MDYKPAKAENIAFGALSVGLALYNIGNADVYQGMDQIFVAVAALCTVEAIVSLLLVFFWKNKISAVLDQVLRAIICVVLIASGIGLLISAVDVKDKWCYRSYNYDPNQPWFDYRYRCQHYEVKLTAGILAIVNGLIYAITKKKDQPQNGVIHSQSPASISTPITPIYQPVAGTPVVPYIMVQPAQGQEMPYMRQQYYTAMPMPQQNYSPNYGNGPPPDYYPKQDIPLQQNTSNQYQHFANNSNHQHNQQQLPPEQ